MELRLSFNTLQEVHDQIETAQKIVLIAHKNPDGDTAGAAMAMYEMLKTRGKDPVLFCVDPYPEFLMFMPSSQEVIHEFDENDYDLAMMFDAGSYKMAGIEETHPNLYFGKFPLVNIDHHFSNEHFGRWNLVDTQSASTTIVLTHMFNYWGWRIPPSVATPLMTGLYTDTGSLKHANATAEVHRVAAQLLRSGARIRDISKYIFKRNKVEVLRLWGRVLQRIEQTPDRITISRVYEQDFKETRTSVAELTGVVDYLNAVPDADFSLLLTMITDTESGKEKVKGSLRTLRDDVDLTKVAGTFGGGGHKKAAGFTVEGELRLERRFRIITPHKNIEDRMLKEASYDDDAVIA